MMLSLVRPTFFIYMTRRFLSAVLATFLSVFALVVIDFVEQLRSVSDLAGVGVMTVALLTFYRVPGITEIVLPFAVLVAGMICFLELSRKLELVVARASGMSAWQFLFPALFSAVMLGVFAATVYNPLVSEMRERSLRMEAEIFGREKQKESRENLWLRQPVGDGQAIINARSATDNGQTLGIVTVIIFNKDSSFRERIDATQGRLKEGYWEFINAQVTPLGKSPRNEERYQLTTSLTASQVNDSFSQAEQVSFWQLPGFISLSRAAGLSASKFELQFQTLLARPLLLVAMVLVAAASSLRFARLGGVARSILGGVVAGFLLYVTTEVAGNLGRSGLVHPILAAWTPGLVGALMGFLVLLNQEDG